MKKNKSLIRRMYNFSRRFIEYHRLKRKKDDSRVNQKALVIRHSSPYIFNRYFYGLIKFFSIEGFDVYLPDFNFTTLNKSHNIIYFNLIYKDNLVLFGEPSRKYELVFELNEDNLSFDYFTPLQNNDYESNCHIPMTMHPLFYHNQFWNTQVATVKKRKKSIFMAGNFNRTVYSKFADTPFKLESRIEIYDYLLKNEILTQVPSFKVLENILSNDEDNICIVLDSFRVSMNELREVISHFYFFLAMPGAVMPFSHNLIEAMSVGTIPIIHKEYALLMSPRLEHMVNAIVYNQLDDIQAKIELAYSLNEESLLRITKNVSQYYQDSLTPKSVIDKITSNSYDRLYLQAERKSVKTLENNLVSKVLENHSDCLD